MGGYPSGQRGLTVNQLTDVFGGSNPSPPTKQIADGDQPVVAIGDGVVCYTRIRVPS